jgi:hypothetical protein
VRQEHRVTADRHLNIDPTRPAPDCARGHGSASRNTRAKGPRRFERMAGRFARVETRRRARGFLLGLLAALPRKNCWTIAESAAAFGTSARRPGSRPARRNPADPAPDVRSAPATDTPRPAMTSERRSNATAPSPFGDSAQVKIKLSASSLSLGSTLAPRFTPTCSMRAGDRRVAPDTGDSILAF